MIKPLMIGKVTFPINLIQGPLAGVSCAPFRILSHRYSQPAFNCTEMISAKTLLQPINAANKRYIFREANEGPVCYQLSANDPEELKIAVQKVTDYGADLIDLNCGCPVKKIRSKGAGSSLLNSPLKLAEMIAAMRMNTHLPISIKIRVDAGIDSNNNEIIKIVNESGIDFIIIHGRHWSEDYSVPCRYEEIGYFVNEVRVPVIGNGDIANLDSLKAILATGCAGAMISRAGVGQPWLIAKLMAESRGETFSLPVYNEIAAIFMEHTERLANLLDNEKLAVLQMRKIAKYYARGFENRLEFTEAINCCESIKDLLTVWRGTYDRKLDCIGF